MSEFTLEEAQKALDKAKIALMCQPDSVFFSTLMLSMRHILDETVQTAETDGYCVWYNPTFLMERCKDSAERLGLILHETLHPAFDHLTRRGDRDPKKWNRAGDYTINWIIINRGMKLPKGGLYDPKLGGPNMTTDMIYDLLDDEKPGETCPWIDLKEPEDQDDRELQEHLDGILIQATIQSKLAGDRPGTIPGNIERYVDSLLNPQIPWHRVLANYFTNMGKTDYSYRRHNRRYLPDFIVPTQYSERICNVATGTDTSCSVTDDQFHHFVSEAAGLLRNLRPDKLTFLQFDTKLQEPVVLRSLSDVNKVTFTGRGGTDIEPLMEWARDNKPAVLIVFTDGYFNPPKFNPGVPVVWIIHGNPQFVAPFGKHIPYTFTG